MNTVLHLETDRSLWIGGSDCAAILGVSPYKSPFQLYQEKINEYHEPITPEKQKIFNRGKRWEPVVIEMLIDELENRGNEVKVLARNNRYVDQQHPFIAAEVDLEILLNGEHVNCEMKTVHPFAAKQWGERETDDIPIYYTTQVLHGMMVTNRPVTIVAALIGADDLRVHYVYRDEDLITMIREKEVDFWHRVRNKLPPDEVSMKDIKRLYEEDDGEVMEADDSLYLAYETLSQLKEQARELEGLIDEKVEEVKKRMKTAAVLIYGGEKLITWKTAKDSVKTDWRAAYFDLKPDPGHAARFTTTKPGARTFLVK